ncbi:hypothetical protein BAUCODRAFT_456066 [Baudoinia panamericana UAMH 10762]|uniref:Uncharacterized protein n=1 Tax=Baudoinia panamericana (strain UAMH 10762) TaxID=717646 RepID=M2N0V4_BAUPA|nr:uncharacterized protein BAUCODRAFT_456066 [Baudoinia panamericana UAMH 10762]EMC97553.1 hypothetical protein BAUCODRAFT_456066 [Baudoinia panamericana UAMH 10762]
MSTNLICIATSTGTSFVAKPRCRIKPIRLPYFPSFDRNMAVTRNGNDAKDSEECKPKAPAPSDGKSLWGKDGSSATAAAKKVSSGSVGAKEGHDKVVQVLRPPHAYVPEAVESEKEYTTFPADLDQRAEALGDPADMVGNENAFYKHAIAARDKPAAEDRVEAIDETEEEDPTETLKKQFVEVKRRLATDYLGLWLEDDSLYDKVGQLRHAANRGDHEDYHQLHGSLMEYLGSATSAE